MKDLSKIETRISSISTMTDDERKEFFDNHIVQLSNALEIINYLEKTKYTKVWHEQADYLMKNFIIINKNK
jgi:hypothetical protein